jgi:hypothetical protein
MPTEVLRDGRPESRCDPFRIHDALTGKWRCGENNTRLGRRLRLQLHNQAPGEERSVGFRFSPLDVGV